MSDPDSKIHKIKLGVEIERDSGVSTGFVFLTAQARLSDLLNDSRRFLPFESHSGKFSAVSKSTILSVTPLDQVDQQYEGDDPYRILDVSENAEMGDIKKAYLSLCADHHPDRIRGMGLSAEYVELANTRMARINEAYQRVLSPRGEGGNSTNGFNGVDPEEVARKEAERRAAEEAAERRAAARAEEHKAEADLARRKAEAEAADRQAATEAAESQKAAAEEAYRKAAAAEAEQEAAEAAAKKTEAEPSVDEPSTEESSTESPAIEREPLDNFFLKAQADIARKVEERAARLAAEAEFDSTAERETFTAVASEPDAPSSHTASEAPKRASDSMRKAAQDLRRESKRRTG